MKRHILVGLTLVGLKYAGAFIFGGCWWWPLAEWAVDFAHLAHLAKGVWQLVGWLKTLRG